MKNTVFFIKNEGKSCEYEGDIQKIIEKIGYVNGLKNTGTVTLSINPYDMADCEYITGDSVKNIQKYISESKYESKIRVSDRLYYSKDDTLKNILLKYNIDSESVFSEETLVNNPCNNIFESIPLYEEILDDTNNLILFSHFKGHSMIGFSGALKNLATNFIGLKGQKELHKLARPFISKIACLSCDACIKSCTEKAISVDNYAHINQKCTGCNVCIESCPNNAIKLNKLNSDEVIRAICEIVSTILNNKKDNKVLFINSLIDIKTYYDCNNSERIIGEDIGILASYNPVALDKACYDLVNKNSSEDKFKKIWRNVDGTLQFNIAEEIGIGSQDYELVMI